ncbi:hypothetical protein [Xanthomonas sp. CFBP 7698]|uniref:hypothetical protein n=1 Tax=Xanthomonas sp. CFBP 7698 TaxID=2082399 RepID=UPI0011C3477A|nr:hypothetical protein [Xanthomonas sp. CFBP 7698]
MPEIQLNREESMRILNNPDAGSEAKVIAACAVAFFACIDGESMNPETRTIAHKLLRMTSSALDEAEEDSHG